MIDVGSWHCLCDDAPDCLCFKMFLMRRKDGEFMRYPIWKEYHEVMSLTEVN